MENTNASATDVDKILADQKQKNWLSDNIASIIALSFIAFSFIIFLLILTQTVKTSESTTITILASLTNILMLIFGYYFGSTKSSKEKDKQIAQMSMDKTIPQNP
jgi:hypothetical protein